jgi:hypothetical protein
MFRRYLVASLLGLVLAQTVLWSCHAAPRAIAAPFSVGFLLPDAHDAAHGQWKYYKVSRPTRDRREGDFDLEAVS